MTQLPLATYRLPAGAHIAPAQRPQKPHTTLASPALSVLTDLTEVRAATVAPHASLRVAETTMIQNAVRLLFVVAEIPSVDGIVTFYNLHGERPLRLAEQRHVHYDDLDVLDVMTPLTELDAVDLRTLASATVGEVVATLDKFGRPYLLVIDSAAPGAEPRIRGLVSRAQIERQLGRPLPAVEVASTFAEIRKALS